MHAATDFWFWAFWMLAVLTMFVGNLGAIVQNNVKRMLAYSSIAHAGYTLVAMAAVTFVRHDPELVAPAYAAVLFYLASYALVSVGAFTIVSEIGGQGERYLTYDDYAGLGTRQPFAAAALSAVPAVVAGFADHRGIFRQALHFHRGDQIESDLAGDFDGHEQHHRRILLFPLHRGDVHARVQGYSSRGRQHGAEPDGSDGGDGGRADYSVHGIGAQSHSWNRALAASHALRTLIATRYRSKNGLARIEQ